MKTDEITIGTIATFAQAQKAIKGDLPSLVYLRDTSGQKPVENIAIEPPKAGKIDDIRAELEKIKQEMTSHEEEKTTSRPCDD